MERGARLSGSRFAYLKGDLVLLELALVSWALHLLPAGGLRARHPARARARARRCSGPASCPTPSSRSTRCPTTTSTSSGTSEVALASLHAGEVLARTRSRAATPASRRASAARRARRARTRAGSSASTSSTRSRCSRSSRPRTRRPSTSASSRSRSGSCSALEIPYRVVAIAVDDLGASAAKKYDLEAWLPGQEPLPRAHLVLEHDRLPGPAARHPPPARRRASRRPSTR